MRELLTIENLNIYFKTHRSRPDTHAISQLDLKINEGEILGIVGESGCGKSLTNLAIMGLLPSNAYCSWNKFRWLGQNYKKFTERDWKNFRGSQIGMIFQNPMNSLNPTLSIQYQIDEILKFHRRELSAQQRYIESVKLLGQVGIPDPENRLKSYPFELSGGMAQRVMIATVMATRPKLLIADEPTTALDVTIQSQVLKLIKDLSQEENMSVIFVTHDLSVVSHMADRIHVMYAGEVIEEGNIQNIIHYPGHPYTKALIASLPTSSALKGEQKLQAIEGNVPHFSNRPSGCQFAPRCDYKKTECTQAGLLYPKEHIKCLFPLNSGGIE